MNITDNIFMISEADSSLDLFEGQYPVPDGVTYNSYVILDDKTAVLDTCDVRKKDEWLETVKKILNGRQADYLIVSHMEPDHSSGIKAFLELFPNVKICATKAAFVMLNNFCGADYSKYALPVVEGDELNLGAHTLKFYTAPMVHWPEVMVSYEKTEKILFSADAFGRFGANASPEICEDARRYYFNIVGKYGVQVTALLNKAASLDIATVCPLHGPILRGNDICKNVEAYKIWSSYAPEKPDAVTVAYASIYGNTKRAAELFCENYDGETELFDLSRADMSAAVSSAFKNGKLVLASSTYDGGIFTPMDNYIKRLKAKAYQKRKIAFIENGSWAPQTARLMQAEFALMKDISILDLSVKILSAVNEKNIEEIKILANKMKDF